MSDEKWLRQAAEEIRKEGHYGWGNTCEQGADRIKALTEANDIWRRDFASLQAENQRLKRNYAELLHEYWSTCESEGLDWGGVIPENPDSGGGDE